MELTFGVSMIARALQFLVVLILLSRLIP